MKYPSEIKRAFDYLNNRLAAYMEEARNMFMYLERAEKQGTLTFTLQLLPDLQKFIRETETELMPSLPKDVAKALITKKEVDQALKKSWDTMKDVLDTAKYRYRKTPMVIGQFIYPPNMRGVGKKTESRLDAHLRVEEAFIRYKDDFSSDMAKDFEAAREAGLILREIWKIFRREETQAKLIIERCYSQLKKYRILRAKIRKRLGGELENSDHVYLYVPKRKSSSKSSRKKNEK